MKKFEFRLASVLRLYEVQLELEQARLAQALAKEQSILKLMEKRAQEVQQQNESLRRALELRSTDLRALSTYNLSAQTQQILWHDELARVRHFIRKQREIVLAHERKWKLVVKLKEKKHAEWTKEVGRQLEAESQELWLSVRNNTALVKPL
jgi:hypothetical protein